MIALLFLCWLGLAAIVLIVIAAAVDELKSRKCPDHLPDWLMEASNERPGE